MKRIELDIHTHTIVSGHAYGTLLENVQEASKKGLKVYGFAEHGPNTPGACDPFYFANLGVIPRVIQNVFVVRGCETNVLNGGLIDLPEKFLAKVDYCYAGIHPVCYQDEGREKNTDNLISCMKVEKVKFVSHPDDDTVAVNYERLSDAAVEYGVALEVNNSSFLKLDRRINCLENYRTMFRLCEKKHVPIILGSDAHFPTAVGNLDLAHAFVNECGVDEGLILNYDHHRLLDFIGVAY